MLFRFSLYGFLKNQRYFEPFLWLWFLDRGLSFTEIGLLIGFRELCVNLLEIPSGALADLHGRRRAMILSFAAYVVSFALFAWGPTTTWLWPAMLAFAIGDSFRTGTHKAMIFAWLRAQGREAERTRVYGFTRSWSKLGSAVSVVVSGAIVLASDSYALLFPLAIVPYTIGIVNFLGYPKELDGHPERPSVVATFRHLKTTLAALLRRPGLRRLIGESMGFEGTFRAVQDYLQPALLVAVVGASAISAGSATAGSTARSAALAVAPVYFALYLLSSLASRKAHVLVTRAGGEAPASRWMWLTALALYFAIAAAAGLAANLAVIAAFVALHALQSLWRPVLIARFDQHSDESAGATVLSVESQGRRGATMVLAPLIGWAVDLARSHDAATALWPVGCAGAVLAVGFAMRRPG